MNRRIKTLTWGAIPLVALASLVSIDHIPGTDISLTVPYAAEGPGPTFNTLGEVDGVEVVEITGADTDEVEGNLNMTTVSVRTGMTLSQALSRWLFTDDTIVPIEQIFPPGQSLEEVQQSNSMAFTASEAAATISAMNFLNLPVEIEVVEVVEDSAASSSFEPGDTLTAVNDTPVTTPGEVQEMIRNMAPGDEVTITYLRGGEESSETVTLGAHPQDPEVPLLGISMTSVPTSDTEVSYNLEDIGGPSAGLIFSLSVYDQLTPGALTGGHRIAGTGTISTEGAVGPIGGIRQKMVGAEESEAEFFLAPAENCDQVIGFEPEGLEVVAVADFDEALTATETIAETGSAEGLPTCEDVSAR